MKLLSAVTLMIFCMGQQSFGQTTDEKSIRQILSDQIRNWNNGDLENFMVGYWENDSLLFIGKSGPKYGYQAALANYRKGYPDTAALGKLQFELLQMKRLSVMYYFVAGKFHLQRTIGDLEGYFTLLFKKIKGKWVIVVDHSS